MKKIILFSIILLGMGSLLIAQTGIEQECVNCKGNDISKNSSAIGEINVATGETSFASGRLNSSTGDYSTTVGLQNSASGNFSFAGGEGSIATGKWAFSYGQYTNAGGVRSLAMGVNTRTIGTNSVAIGRFVEATTSDAMIFGCGLDADRYISNSINGSFMIGYNSNVHTFFVGSAYGENTTGSIGIGNVTDPEAKLHIRGDDLFWNTDDASLFIESAGSRYSYIYLGDQNHYIKTKPSQNFEFNAAGQDFYFNNGDVGIGTSSPEEKLEVEGTIQATAYKGDGSLLTNVPGDNLGNHLLTQNLLTSGYWINSDSDPNQGIYIGGDGQVGIGTNQVYNGKALTVNGSISAVSFYGDGSQLTGIEGDNLGNHILTQNLLTSGHWINSDSDQNQGIFIDGEGRVGIGTTYFGTGEETYKLAVAGAIRAEEVKIENMTNWYDCVFEDDYQLQSLGEVEAFVKENKHLPDVPCEAEVMEEGISLGEMNAILLKKVEELTLHLIDQQKQIDELKKALGQQ